MEVGWLDAARLDRRDVAGAVAVLEAAREADAWPEPAATVSTFTADLLHGWDGDPPTAAVGKDARGRVIGVLELSRPRWDNFHSGRIDVTVDPLARRRGVGRALFEIGLARLRAEGRSLILVDCFDRPGDVAFCTAMGLHRGSEEDMRRQDLSRLDWSRLESEFAAAERRAAGYELVRMAGSTPEALVADVVRMTAAINDAPTDDLDIEDEVFSAERLRAFEVAQAARGRRIYRLVARKRGGGGELAGHTVVGVDADRPGLAEQYDTSVQRAHRGHRLGVLLKIDMLRWLAEEEPQLRTLDTWNATSNAHMVAVNELLGYSVVDRGIGWQRHL